MSGKPTPHRWRSTWNTDRSICQDCGIECTRKERVQGEADRLSCPGENPAPHRWTGEFGGCDGERWRSCENCEHALREDAPGVLFKSRCPNPAATS